MEEFASQLKGPRRLEPPEERKRIENGLFFMFAASFCRRKNSFQCRKASSKLFMPPCKRQPSRMAWSRSALFPYDSIIVMIGIMMMSLRRRGARGREKADWQKGRLSVAHALCGLRISLSCSLARSPPRQNEHKLSIIFQSFNYFSFLFAAIPCT